MSLGRPNLYEHLSPQDYQANQAIIKQAKACIKTFENMNESARERFQERESRLEQARKELQRKVEEGEQARRLLEQLETQQPSGSTSQDLVPFTPARIEEVPINDVPNQHVLGSQSISPRINAGPRGELQSRLSTQFSGNLGGDSSPWISPAGQQSASYYKQPLLPQYRPSPMEQFQQHHEALPSQNTTGVRYGYPPPPPNMNTAGVPSQPYGPVFVQPPPGYGYPQQTMLEAGTSSTMPRLHNPPRPVQQRANQGNNKSRHTATFTSTSTSGNSFAQPNNRKESAGPFQTSSNVMLPTRNADAHQPSHVIPKPTNSSRTIQNPPAAGTINPSTKLLEILDSYVHKLSDNDILRNLDVIRKWADQVLPGASCDLLSMKLVKDHQGRILFQIGDFSITVEQFFRILINRRTELATKSNPALPVETKLPIQPPSDNIQHPNPPASVIPSTSGANVPLHPTVISTTPVPANLPRPFQATSTKSLPSPAIPPRPSQTISNPVALPSPSQANKKHLAQDILFALGKRKRRPSASGLKEQPTKKLVSEPSTSSPSLVMKSALNGTLPTSVFSKASELDTRQPSTITTPMVNAPLPVAPQTHAPGLADNSLPSISKGVATTRTPTPYTVMSWKAVPQTAKPSSSAVFSSGGLRVGAPPLTRTMSATPMVPGARGTSSSGPSKGASLPLTQPFAGPSAPGPSATGLSTQTMTLASATSGPTSSSTSHSLGLVPSPLTSSGAGDSSTSIPSPSPLAQTAATPQATSGSGGLPQPTPPIQTAPVASTSIVPASGIIGSQPPVSVSSSGVNKMIDLASSARKDAFPTQREPLFLPSSVSPEPEPSQAPDLQRVKAALDPITGSNRQKAKRKNLAYVLLPPLPEYLIRARRQGEGQPGLRSRQSVTSESRKDGTRTSSVSTSLVGEEDYDKIQSRRDQSVDENEVNAVTLSCSRLQELPCRWDGCDVKMNSVDSLIRHLNQHKPRASSNNLYFTCRWTQCGRRCTFKEKHLEKHATLPLQCAYADCSDSFRTAGQLVKHFQARHTDDALKPAAGIFAPRLETLPPSPKTVPSYMLVTRAVLPQNISRERHQLLIPWVVRNIVSSDHEVRVAKQRVRKTARPINHAALPAGGPSADYEFLKTRSTRYSTWLSRPVDIKLDDLDSAEVSRMVDEGLLLWGPAEVGNFAAEGRGNNINDADPPQSPLLTPTRPSKRPATELRVPRGGASDPPHDNGHSSDEDMVEDMLRDTPVQ